MQPDALSVFALRREHIHWAGKVDGEGSSGGMGQGEVQLPLEGQQLQPEQDVRPFHTDDLGQDRGRRLCQDPLQCYLHIRDLRLLPEREHSRPLACREPPEVCLDDTEWEGMFFDGYIIYVYMCM